MLQAKAECAQSTDVELEKALSECAAQCPRTEQEYVRGLRLYIYAQYHSSAGKIYKIYFSALSISLCLLNVFIRSLGDEAQI